MGTVRAETRCRWGATMGLGKSVRAIGDTLRRTPLLALIGLSALLWGAPSHADTLCGPSKDPKTPKTCYSLTTDERGQPPKLALNDELVAQIYGDMPAK